MRHLIKGLIAAVAVMAAAPAMACGYSACWQPPVYVAPVAYGYAGCGGCGGWGWGVRERLPDPEQQYYYVNQGPTYTGPGAYAPVPTYSEGGSYRVQPYYGYRTGYGTWRPRAGYYGYGYRPYRAAYRYGYGPRAYGYRHVAPYGYGRPLRRYF